MADRPQIQSQPVNRAKIATFFKIHELIKAFEDLQRDVTEVLPDFAETNASAIDEATFTADLAVSIANSATWLADLSVGIAEIVAGLAEGPPSHAIDDSVVEIADQSAEGPPPQTVADLGLENVENTALSTWSGSTNIITLGTISTGTWQGTTVAVANGGTGTTTSTGTGSIVLSSQPSFGTTVGVGGATASASGSGVTFPASASVSTDANTLDDYEEGSFSPTLTCGTSGTITVDTAEDTISYTKIGRVVYISGQFSISSVSSPTGTVTLNNLPFSSASLPERAESALFNIVMSNTTTNTPTFYGVITAAGVTTITIRAKDNTGAVNASPASLFAASDVWISGHYLTNS